jgi:hypothetical protein
MTEEKIGRCGSAHLEKAFANGIPVKGSVKVEIYATGSALFGSIETFQRWMTAENIALGGTKPVDLLPSRYGARLILDVLAGLKPGSTPDAAVSHCAERPYRRFVRRERPFCMAAAGTKKGCRCSIRPRAAHWPRSSFSCT